MKYQILSTLLLALNENINSYGRGRGAPVGGAGGQFYKNNFQMQDDYGDEEDMDDYGMYYAEEDSEDMDGQYAGPGQNYPPGSMFQGQNKVGGPMGMGAGGMSSASGVPFYGQQNKPAAAASGFAYGGIGGGAGGFMGGMGGIPSQNTQKGGGFTYGMASQGGNLFGPPATGAATNFGGTQFGAPSTQNSNPGLFKFGQVSSMGGIGSTFGAGSAGGLFGSGPMVGASDDPYANIALDLNKIKKSEPPAKLHEHKSDEEKKKEAEAKKTAATSNPTGKSNLKKDYEDKKNNQDDDEEQKRKRSVSFGKSTTYEVDRVDSEASAEFINKDSAGGKGSPRPKKIIAEKEIGDGRSDKEKILEMLEKKQREELEEIQSLNVMQKNRVEDSLGDSSSMSNTYPIQKPSQLAKDGKSHAETSNSYESDDFEDVSASGSGSKSKLVHWPGKDAFTKQKDVQPAKSKDEQYDGNAMDAYIKKQQQNQQPLIRQKPVQYEESQSYDEDFESMSKSQTALTSSMLTSPKGTQSKQATNTNQQQKQPFQYKPPVQVVEYKSVAEQYQKKENKFIQTDETKYDHMSSQQQVPTTYKEMTMQNNLRDAEHIIQDLKSTNAEQKEKIKDFELQMKKKDVDFQSQRRELLNEQENAKRYLEQYKDCMHKVNLQKIEIEELIKQIDLADAKTRIKEDELKLAQAEYDKKLKMQEERLIFKISKQEDRDNLDLKRQHMLEREELKQKISEHEDEIHYLTSKVNTIENENKKLRLGNDSNKRIKELEDQVQVLQSQVASSSRLQQENINLKNIKNDLSKEDQVKLQRELQQLELMVKGYQEENEKSVQRCKQLENQLKLTNEKAFVEQRKVKDLQQKALLNSEKVYVEQVAEELDIQTVNNMGLGNAISQKTLQDLHSQLQRLQNEKQDYERDMSIKETQLKSQINKLREEKSAVEKQLIDTEFIVGDKNSEMQKLRDEFRMSKEQTTQQIYDLEEKISWFRQNQRLIADEDKDRENLLMELTQLREKCKKLEIDVKRTIDLEKKCKLLEETIKSKNPNSIPMLLQAVKETSNNGKQQNSQDQDRISQLEIELENKDREFEKKLRTLRQEQERMKQLYEKRQGQTPESKRILELEEEIQTTKNYYNKRIREIEDKYKFRIPDKEEKKTVQSKPPTLQKGLKDNKQVKTSNKQPIIDITDNKQQEEMIDRLTKERNLLAQKVVNLETQNNKRRQSFSGLQPTTQAVQLVDDSKHPVNAIYSIANLIKLNPKKETVFGLIEAALICVELLQSKDPLKNKIISEKLLQLTQDFNISQKVNDLPLNEILNLCKQDLQQPQAGFQNDLKLKNQQSESDSKLNNDIQSVMNSFVENDLNPFRTNQKQVSHPFVVSSKNQQPNRQPIDLLKLIVQSNIDFERIVKERQLNPLKLQVKDIYQILREEDPNTLNSISTDEVKQLIKFVRDKSSSADDAEIIYGDKNSEESVNVYDLVNAVMDVSLDVLGMLNNNKQDQNVNTRYSQDMSPQKPNQLQQYQEENSLLKDMIRKLQEGKDQNNNFNYQDNDKISRLQSIVNQLTSQNRDLLGKNEKLESSKQRMERILKQNVGNSIRNTLRKTQNGAENVDNNIELFDELAVVMKRIEFLEQQSEEREKVQDQGHGPCKRELMRLSQEIEEERQDKIRLVSKKNAEVAYFKAELDALLSEMKNTIGNKNRKTTNSQYNNLY
eukprot:403369452